MKKNILITGSTDGLGFATAKRLLSLGHNVILHGRDNKKLNNAIKILCGEFNLCGLPGYICDLSDLREVNKFSKKLLVEVDKLDVLINNAGVYNIPNPITKDGLDSRFVVNSIAPYLLTTRIIELFENTSRIINLSSAAQSSVDINVMLGNKMLNADNAYAQSKLALTMWAFNLANKYKDKGLSFIAVNPKSFLNTNMVKNAYNMQGVDINFGVDILEKATLSDEFNDANGKYFDNDRGAFSNAHPDAYNKQIIEKVISTMESIIKEQLGE